MSQGSFSLKLCNSVRILHDKQQKFVFKGSTVLSCNTVLTREIIDDDYRNVNVLWPSS